jgi:hypothetical protein
MARHEINPMTAATAKALAVSYLNEHVPTYPPGTDVPAFRRGMEIVLTDDQLVPQYLGVLDNELDRTTPEGAFFEAAEIDRFADEGLTWVPAERLALLAIDRGAVSAMHDLVVELWSDYWWQRSIDAERERGTWTETSALIKRIVDRQMRGRILPIRKIEKAKVDEPAAYLLAAEEDASVAAPLLEQPADRVLDVPIEQTVWRVGTPTPLTVIITTAADPPPGHLIVKLSPLPLYGKVRCHGWLADAGLAVVRGTHAKFTRVSAFTLLAASLISVPGMFTLEFALPAVSKARYFVAEYRSAKRDVFFAAALDGSRLSVEMTAKLFAAAAADLAKDEPARAAELLAPRGP